MAPRRTHAPFLFPALAHAFAFTALFVFITTGHEVLIVERGLSPRAFGVLFSTSAVVFAVTNVAISKALRHGANLDSSRLVVDRAAVHRVDANDRSISASHHCRRPPRRAQSTPTPSNTSICTAPRCHTVVVLTSCSTARVVQVPATPTVR